jgi:hypothetical protein
MRTTNQWTREQAIMLCVHLEEIAALCDGHVALTGGTLYKMGPRKDLDILIYPVRGKVFDWKMFFVLARKKFDIHHNPVHDYGWCKKAQVNGKFIDFFDPMAEHGAHRSGGEAFDELVAEQAFVNSLTG